MATWVTFIGVNSYLNTLEFRFGDGYRFYVKSFNDGIMVILIMPGQSIDDYAKRISACFEKGSNFNGLKAIEFDFNGLYISVTPENATYEKIIKLWTDKIKLL